MTRDATTTMNLAAESLLKPRQTQVVPFVAVSVAAHVVFAGAFMLVSWLFGAPRVDLNQKPITASLVRLGKQRDEKLLPRKEAEPPPPPKAEKPVEVKAPPPPEKAVAIPTKDAKPEPAKPSKEAGAKDAKKSLFDAFNKTSRAAKPEELEGREDGDVDGNAAKQEGERYFGLLNAVVKRNYDVSNTIDEAERRRLRAEVALRIGAGGELLDVSLTKPSGNDVFDSAVLGAVKKAAPFTAPPEHLRDSLKKSGVAFVFTP